MLKDKLILTAWLPQAIIITILCGFMYISVQQILRQLANDPQIQLAEDWANTLNKSGSVSTFTSKDSIDIGKSLAPFIIIYDSAGKPVISNGYLHYTTPSIPLGTLQSAKANGQNRLTWMPEKGVRIAAVITPYSSKAGSGFVLAGRSLREVQMRISKIDVFCVSTWVILLALSFLINFTLKLPVKEKHFR
ncbi:MAG: hypothetical protein Q8903_10655 [Bacteroidota bacterium]|nr:hypothetical protein [Bacteroidota bacterium]